MLEAAGDRGNTRTGAATKIPGCDTLLLRNYPPRHLQETVKTADDFVMPLAVIGGYLVCLALLARWGRESIAHRRRINKLDFRIHVNGIRGKSTVSRIIAGLLREGGIVTIAQVDRHGCSRDQP